MARFEDHDIVNLLDHIYATDDEELDCARLQALLPVVVEIDPCNGDLPRRFADVCAHLEQCPDCREEYRALREVIELHARGDLPPVEQLLAQLEPESEPEVIESQPVPVS